MNSLQFDLRYCYGIDSFEHIFVFDRKNKCFLIYAPNGTMKTSFSKTMDDFKIGIDPKDIIFKSRNSHRKIIKSDGSLLSPEEVFVIQSYNENFESNKLSSLLVSKDLKKQYDDIHKEIKEKKAELIKKIAETAGFRSPQKVEEEIITSFIKDGNDLFEALEIIKKSNVLEENYNIPMISYESIINTDVKNFVENKDVKLLLKEYIEKYNELMEKSQFFKKGVFNHTNATNVSKSLNDNGFFKIKYGVVVGNRTINTKSELESLIKDAKKDILNNDELSKRFESIDKLIKNAKLRSLRDLLEDNPELISELQNFDILKKKLWVLYLKDHIDLYNSLMDLYEFSKVKLKEIIALAKKEETQWNNVVDIFNNRFNVPFTVSVENKEDVILKETTPTLKFTYEDREDEVDIDKKDLLSVLSNGESRALYILNIIFEIEALKKDNKEILIIIDDIADSFDYKNKYAIVEYLKEIKDTPIFRPIILTHNFDFYRTVAKRLSATRLMTSKQEDKIVLKTGNYANDVFNDWKDSLEVDNKKLIASIPFIRNISEYIEEKNSKNYLDLTSMLHMKSNTREIMVDDLEIILNDLWRTKKNLNEKGRRVLDIIYEEAGNICRDNTDEISLENKIVLSIAIRLKAEEFMISKINDESFTSNIPGAQTGKLLKKFKKLFKEDRDIIKKLEQVSIMTPENIHMNSFMYEPLLDMSDMHLKKLYKDIYELNSEEIDNKQEIV
ncbi:MAG: hypothetical protein ACRC3Y_14225 [Romboutsia sp.]|uniref:hypothetical protein n=1 Tax=Romboutsia sp. TaxID=1965302 RepID=UPI003F3F9D9D